MTGTGERSAVSHGGNTKCLSRTDGTCYLLGLMIAGSGARAALAQEAPAPRALAPLAVAPARTGYP